MRVRGLLRTCLRTRVLRVAIVDLLRPMRDIGLFDERGLSGVFQVNQRRDGCPALRLCFQCQPQKSLIVLLIGLTMCFACQAGKNGLQRLGLRYKHGFH